MKIKGLFQVLVIFLCLLSSSCAGQDKRTMILATTTSTEDSGLLDILIPAFEKECDVKVKVVAVGSGQAMEMGERGDADVLLVHSRKAEEEFIAKGYGINRKDVMHNEFLIVGPAADPAGIKGTAGAAEAFEKIASANAKFISRADKSGTHSKEKSIWKKAGITPVGEWYIESGQGMGDTLMMAGEKGAYTLTDEATYLSMRDKLKLMVMVSGDEVLFNPYSVIAVNPEKHPSVNNKAAMKFIEFVIGEKGQSIINNFGKDKYGKSLFTPDAVPFNRLTH